MSDAQYLIPPPDWMPEWVVAPLIGGFSLADFLGIFVLLNFILFFVMFEIWLERKVGGHIQLRRGPLHVGPHGALQSPADVLKLLTKEDLIPEVADRRTFRMAPYLVFVPVFMTFLIIPWGALGPLGDLVLRPFDLALVYLVAIPALQAIGLVIAGWSSGNKYALLGSARFVAQLISYELPMVVALLGVAVLAQSLSLTRVVEVQRETLWFIFLQPIGFLIFLVASMAEMSRTPFDIAIAESEIVGGPFIEYSGMRWGMFFLAEFAAVFLNAALAVALFMGGGEVVPLWGHLGTLVPAAAPLVELVNQGGVLWFFGKTLTLIVFIQWCRFTLPRLRIDQLMGLAWKVLLPAAFLNLILSAVYVTFGFLPFAVGVGLCLLSVLFLALAYRNRLRPQTGGIQLVTVPRTPEVVGS
ncbi:MAG TPA: NADH-quinone oxidoreductase subunit NuoH [Chloroflexota bacterium]|nr:NADH-quinone oxidoreductase subunit NuoH [Chloroflexota bacterium]